MISIDFETRSKTNLLTDGVYNYASCPSTEVICMYYSVDGQEPLGWHPGDPIPEVFAETREWYAWNATFERLIWDFIMVNDHGAPAVPIERWKCTAFMSRCNNLPGKLTNAARCLAVNQQKSERGMALIKLLCVPVVASTTGKVSSVIACRSSVAATRPGDAWTSSPSSH